jgi:hypothetical protein
MEPTGDLVAQPGQVTVALGPYLQHRRVVKDVGNLLAR